MDNALLIALIVAVVGSNATLWYKLGRVEAGMRRMCPFGECPVFKRAKDEAMPDRPQALNVKE